MSRHKSPDPFVVVIPCSKVKGTKKTLAMNLYTGRYYGSCLRYARSLVATPATSILILSAKYGLVRLHQEIEPYDLEMRAPEAVMAPAVRQRAVALGLHEMPALILGGSHYTMRASYAFPRNICLSSCLVDRGIGAQMQWMERNHGRPPAQFRSLLENLKRKEPA